MEGPCNHLINFLKLNHQVYLTSIYSAFHMSSCLDRHTMHVPSQAYSAKHCNGYKVKMSAWAALFHTSPASPLCSCFGRTQVGQ